MKRSYLLLTALLAVACSNGAWEHKDTYVDAFKLSDQVTPTLCFDGDSTYTIKDWYGVPGYDVQFRLKEEQDSMTIYVFGDLSHDQTFYYFETGLEDYPIGSISPGVFEPNNTLCSGFWGDEKKGRVWSYVYLYDINKKWLGGHLYTLYWGEAPAQPIWSVEGKSVNPGLPEGISTRLDAYADGKYIIRDWYGIEKYDLEFSVLPDGGIKMLDYYASEADGSVWVQARRSDLGDPLIPQAEPNGAFELSQSVDGKAPEHGRLHFDMHITDANDQPIEDSERPEYVFEW